MLTVTLPAQPKQITVGQAELRLGYFVKFSELWQPGNIGIIAGELYQIAEQQQLRTPRSFICPQLGAGPTSFDYIDVDLSDVAQTSQQLFPSAGEYLNEIWVGMRPWNGFIQLHSPKNSFILQMDVANQAYDITSPTLRLIGAIRPEESPVKQPQIRLFTLFNQTPIFIRLHVEAPLYDTCVLEFFITRNRLYHVEEPDPKDTLAVQRYNEAKRHALYIPTIDENIMKVAPATIESIGQSTQAGPSTTGLPVPPNRVAPAHMGARRG